jgi:putative transposase
MGRRALTDIASLVTPDTILRWHRQLIAEKWTHKRRSPGRRRVMQVITELTLRMARDNRSWGYTRIQGALHNVGHRVGRTTIANILKENGIGPAPERDKRTTWNQFLKAHWSVLAAADFFTVEVWGLRGLVTFYVFFVIELATRRIEIAGITPGPNESWMMQIGRNLTDPVDGFLADKKIVILDRDSKYSAAFRSLLVDAGVEPLRLPARSLNLNAHAERFVRSIKDECLSRMIFFGERSLRKATREYAAHYHGEKNHEGIDKQRNRVRTAARWNAAFLSPSHSVANSPDTTLLQPFGRPRTGQHGHAVPKTTFEVHSFSLPDIGSRLCSGQRQRGESCSSFARS